jgi:hypothetical protein
MADSVKVEVDGDFTEVELKPCRTCGKMPTEEDAKKAVAHSREMIKPCAVCGGKPRMDPKHALYHSTECNGRGGFILCGTGMLDLNWHSDWATVWSTGPAGTVEGAFHVACLKKVAPGIVIHP